MKHSTKKPTSKNAGSVDKAYATLTRVQQLFIDTVRRSGGNNDKRLLIVAGYHTDIEKTCSQAYTLPKDSFEGHLFISVHCYTPWQFCGMTEDADWGKMLPTWGTASDVAQQNKLFDEMQQFCTKNNLPAFIGELGVTAEKESASRIRWLSHVMRAASSRKMVPVLWDTGADVARSAPYRATKVLLETLKSAFGQGPREQAPSAVAAEAN